jgi:hypothetical protein
MLKTCVFLIDQKNKNSNLNAGFACSQKLSGPYRFEESIQDHPTILTILPGTTITFLGVLP